MLLLLETPLGFALFKVLDERKLSTVDVWDWSKEFFSSADSARQVDSLTIEATGYLVDLDQALNTYAMRVKTKYGQHFPELANIVKDDISYAKAAKLMGYRSNAADLDFSQLGCGMRCHCVNNACSIPI